MGIMKFVLIALAAAITRKQAPEAIANPGAPVYQPAPEAPGKSNSDGLWTWDVKNVEKKKFGLPGPVPAPFELEKCPVFANRRTLTDGKTEAVPYPKEGYNCQDVYF